MRYHEEIQQLRVPRAALRTARVRCFVSCSKPLHHGVDADVTKLPSKLPSVGRSTFRRRSASPAIGSTLSGNAVRLEAIYNVEAYVPPAISFVPGEEPGEVF